MVIDGGSGKHARISRKLVAITTTNNNHHGRGRRPGVGDGAPGVAGSVFLAAGVAALPVALSAMADAHQWGNDESNSNGEGQAAQYVSERPSRVVRVLLSVSSAGCAVYSSISEARSESCSTIGITSAVSPRTR